MVVAFCTTRGYVHAILDANVPTFDVHVNTPKVCIFSSKVVSSGPSIAPVE